MSRQPSSVAQLSRFDRPWRDHRPPYTIAVSDTAAHVAAAIDALNANSHVTTIALTDAGTPALTLTVAQLGDSTALGEITTPYTIAVSDTAAHVAAAIDALNANTHITTIALTDSGTPTLVLTSAQAANDSKALSEITTSYTITISNAGLNITASAAAISANLDLYETSLPASITITDNNPLTLTVGQISADATALSLTANANGSAYTVAIADTAAHVAADIDALNANSHITTIALSDPGTPALTLSVAQLSDATALGEITTPYTIAVSDTAAHVAAAIDALNANSHVTTIALTDAGTPALTLTVAQLSDSTALGEITTPYTIAVSDTAAHVAAAIDALNANSHVTTIALTDAGTPTLVLTSAQAANDSKALSEITTSYTITISNAGLNITASAAAISANLDLYETSLPASITITDNNPLTLTVGQISADATALSLTANANGSAYTVAIADTAAHVAADIDALNANSHITTIALSDPGTPALTLSVAQLGDSTALGEITTPYTIAVSDTAAHVAAAIDALNANSHVTTIALTDAGTPALTLTVAQLGDSTALGEITTPYTIAISDTAAHVAAAHRRAQRQHPRHHDRADRFRHADAGTHLRSGGQR